MHTHDGGAILFRQLLVPLLLALHQTMELNGKKKKIRLRRGEIFGEAVLVLGRTDKATTETVWEKYCIRAIRLQSH